MKKVISVLICIIMAVQLMPFSASAVLGNDDTYYIDSINGDDSNTGKSPDQAFKTVSNVPSYALDEGDRVLFKRGGKYECNAVVFVCSGSKENPIIISSYGNENEPLPLIYTNQHTEVFQLFDCSYVTVSNLEITAHNGGGIWIDTRNKPSDGITLTGLKIHDIQNVDQKDRDILLMGAAYARACVMVKGLPAISEFPVNNLTITNCEMYDCGNGISLWGSWNTGDQLWFYLDRSVPPVYNENALIKDCYFHDMTAEAVVVGICKNALVTHCRAINCCQDEGLDENGNISFMNAAMWFWGSYLSTIEYCEIAGQKNKGDGMAVDFDSYSNYCTYRYIYSHDNSNFMCNNAKDDPQVGNTVHHCLSVNDNQSRIRFSTPRGEYNFKFYNNTIINCADVNLMGLHDSLVANNIFMPAKGYSVNSDFDQLISFSSWGNTFKNNCYYNFTNPIVDAGSLNTLPGFTGSDLSDPESFKLQKGSRLIGAGAIIDGDDADKDFFGNEITSNNIGCYESDGEEPTGEKIKENFIEKIGRLFATFFKFIFTRIASWF